MSLNLCYRIYPNGSQSASLSLSEKETSEWVEYNKTFRFGCALFVNHKCVERGVYIHPETIADLESRVQVEQAPYTIKPLSKEALSSLNKKSLKQKVKDFFDL